MLRIYAEALDRLRVRLNMYLVSVVVHPFFIAVGIMSIVTDVSERPAVVTELSVDAVVSPLELAISEMKGTVGSLQEYCDWMSCQWMYNRGRCSLSLFFNISC